MTDHPTWAYRFREGDMDYVDDHEVFAAFYVCDPNTEVSICWWEFDA